MTWCYVFEAVSIQSFVFAGGKLRDVAGASLLLDNLFSWTEDDLTADVLEALKPLDVEKIRFSRRAGGGLIAYSGDRDLLVRFRAVLTMAVRATVPGLPFMDALAEGASAREAFLAARPVLQAGRNRIVNDPLRTGPFHRLAQRTGAPAVELPPHLKDALRFAEADGSAVHGEMLDAGLWAKRAAIDHSVVDDRDPLGDKFASPDGEPRDSLFAVELNRDDGPEDYPVMPFIGDNQYIGLIHADGNGLGHALQAVSDGLADAADEDFINGFRDFSMALATATRAAAHRATIDELEPVKRDDVIKKPVLPMRPILLGGDDLTVIVRGDRAVLFTQAFLKYFEDETRSAFTVLRGNGLNVPESFSAGAGIAFVKAKQPFAQAYSLCESLAKFAKTQAKASVGAGETPPSLLAFHRVSTAHIHESYHDVLDSELHDLDHRRCLSLNPYRVDTAASKHSDGAYPSLSALRKLRDAIDNEHVAKGVIRELTGDFLVGMSEERLKRGLDVLQKRSPAAHGTLTDALAALGCAAERLTVERPSSEGGETPVEHTPLFDALSLLAVERIETHKEDTR